MNICVIIPTYNESKTIAELIQKIRKQNLNIFIVDDGSSDNTAEIAKENGAIVLINPANEGKGASLIRGFNYGLERGFDAVITMDGDGQHLPADLPYFIRLAENSNSSIFIGNRMLKANRMPPLRRLTNKFMSWIISRAVKQKIPDTQCGFRLIKKELFKKMLLRTCKYEIESEMLIKAARLGFKIESIPIETVYLNGKSRINPLLDTLRFIKFIFRELWTTQC